FISNKTPNVHDIVLLNRQLSTLYGLLLIYLVFLLALGFGLPRSQALFAALLLAFCDLHCTYSHYGIPASGYVLGVYLSVYGAQRIVQQKRFGRWWLALGTAVAFAFKFDFIPLLLGGSFLLWRAVWGLQSSKAAVRSQPSNWYGKADIPLAVGLFIFFFGLLTGFSWSIPEIIHSWQTLHTENTDVIPVDRHWLMNPIVYLAAIVGGIGVPAFGLAAWGLWRLPLPKLKQRPDLILLIGIILLEVLVRWSIDTPFVRRANVFMPAICLAAAQGWRIAFAPNGRMTIRSHQIKWLVIIYTGSLTLVGQSNHWWDTRAAARDWMTTHLPADAKILATPYAVAKGLPQRTEQLSEAQLPLLATPPRTGELHSPQLGEGSPNRMEQGRIPFSPTYLLLHEAYYHRYTLSMTTAGGYPNCCSEVYHCQGEKICHYLQQTVSGQNPAVELIAYFPTRQIHPERIIYHHFFGNYETFLGDVLLYRTLPADLDQ
ncbi:MAG: glycosyltransferase family 39 protein, partial [Bacteroidota bacterium]